MLRTILLLTLVFLSFATVAQNFPDSSQLAAVNVFVTDMKGKPSKGEQVFFRNKNSFAVYGGRSDAAGRFSLRLPVGAQYLITVKSINDTAKYGQIEIPALGPEEFYTEPFRVDVKFELARTYTLDNVHFDFGKATLRPDSYKELEELVSYLKIKDNLRVEIAGHTDNVGKDAENLKLSQQRAESIRNFILQKGIAAGRITAKGYGATQPVADNNTEEGRQLNRRTEVRTL